MNVDGGFVVARSLIVEYPFGSPMYRRPSFVIDRGGIVEPDFSSKQARLTGGGAIHS